MMMTLMTRLTMLIVNSQSSAPLPAVNVTLQTQLRFLVFPACLELSPFLRSILAHGKRWGKVRLFAVDSWDKTKFNDRAVSRLMASVGVCPYLLLWLRKVGDAAERSVEILPTHYCNFVFARGLPSCLWRRAAANTIAPLRKQCTFCFRENFGLSEWKANVHEKCLVQQQQQYYIKYKIK